MPEIPHSEAGSQPLEKPKSQNKPELQSQFEYVVPESQRFVPDNYTYDPVEKLRQHLDEIEPYPGYPSEEMLVQWDEEQIKQWEEAGFPDELLPPMIDDWSEDKLLAWGKAGFPKWWMQPVFWHWSPKHLNAAVFSKFDIIRNRLISSDRNKPKPGFIYPHFNYYQGQALRLLKPDKFKDVERPDEYHPDKPLETSFGGPLQRTKAGRALFPYYEEILKRGVAAGQDYLGFYWPNKNKERGAQKAADPVVLCEFTDENGQKVLKVLMIERTDTNTFALPGGMVDPGEPAATAALRELFEEAGVELSDAEIEIIAAEVVIEGRITLNAWPESIATYVPVLEEMTRRMRFKKQETEVRQVRWLDVSESSLQKLHSPTHREFIKLATARWQERTGRVVSVDGRIGERAVPVASAAEYEFTREVVDIDLDAIRLAALDRAYKALDEARSVLREILMEQYPDKSEAEISTMMNQIDTSVPLPGVESLDRIEWRINGLKSQDTQKLLDDYEMKLKNYRDLGTVQPSDFNYVMEFMYYLDSQSYREFRQIVDSVVHGDGFSSVGSLVRKLDSLVNPSMLFYFHNKLLNIAFDSGNGAWAAVTNFFSQDKDTRPSVTPDSELSPEEIAQFDKNRGADFANVIIARDMLRCELIDVKNEKLLAELPYWVDDQRSVALKLSEYPEIENLIFSVARMYHNSWSISKSRLDTSWEKQYSWSEVNRRKSLVSAASIVDSLIMAGHDSNQQPTVITNPLEIKKLVTMKLDVEPTPPQSAIEWNRMIESDQVTWNEPHNYFEENYLDALYEALRSDQAEINGGRSRGCTHEEALQVIAELQSPNEYTTLDATARLVHSAWLQRFMNESGINKVVARSVDGQHAMPRTIEEVIHEEGEALTLVKNVSPSAHLYQELSEEKKQENRAAVAILFQEIRSKMVYGELKTPTDVLHFIEKVLSNFTNPDDPQELDFTQTPLLDVKELCRAQQRMWVSHSLQQQGLRFYQVNQYSETHRLQGYDTVGMERVLNIPTQELVHQSVFFSCLGLAKGYIEQCRVDSVDFEVPPLLEELIKLYG